MSGVGTIQVQPDVVPPLRSFRVQPETTPAIPPDPAAAAAPPAAEDASLSSPEAPRAQPRERTSAPAADVNRRHRGGAQLQAVAHRGKHIEHSEGITPDRAVARATDDPGASAAHPLMSRAQREAIVTAVMQDGKGVVPDASAPFPGLPGRHQSSAIQLGDLTAAGRRDRADAATRRLRLPGDPQSHVLKIAGFPRLSLTFKKACCRGCFSLMVFPRSSVELLFGGSPVVPQATRAGLRQWPARGSRSASSTA
jgi:hypothetical protein